MAETTAGEAFVAVLSPYADELAPLLRAAADDEPDAVHQARILVRRVRGVLAAARSCVDRARADVLRDLLEPLGDDLGEVRDLEVRIAQAEDQVAAGADAAVVERLIVRERERYRAAHDVLQRELDDVDAPLEALAAFLADPPFIAASDDPAAVAAASAVRHELRRVRRAERAALGDLDSLHRLRRSTRRLRYVAEAFTEDPAVVLDGTIAALAAAAKQVQDVLGDHRDATLFALEVRRAEEAARLEGTASHDFARIVAAAFATAAGLIEDLPEAVGALHEAVEAAEQALAAADDEPIAS